MAKSSFHNPKAGPGYSAGKTPPPVTKGHTAHPKYSNGTKVQTQSAGKPAPKGASPVSGGGMKAGDHAMMRRKAY